MNLPYDPNYVPTREEYGLILMQLNPGISYAQALRAYDLMKVGKFTSMEEIKKVP